MNPNVHVRRRTLDPGKSSSAYFIPAWSFTTFACIADDSTRKLAFMASSYMQALLSDYADKRKRLRHILDTSRHFLSVPEHNRACNHPLRDEFEPTARNYERNCYSRLFLDNDMATIQLLKRSLVNDSTSSRGEITPLATEIVVWLKSCCDFRLLSGRSEARAKGFQSLPWIFALWSDNMRFFWCFPIATSAVIPESRLFAWIDHQKRVETERLSPCFVCVRAYSRCHERQRNKANEWGTSGAKFLRQSIRQTDPPARS